MAFYLDEAGLAEVWAKVKGVLGEAVKIELLWENASPTSRFSGQTIALDLSAYAVICVQHYSASYVPNSGKGTIPEVTTQDIIFKCGEAKGILKSFSYSTSSSYNVFDNSTRKITLTDESVVFGGAFSEGIWNSISAASYQCTSTGRNTQCVPQKIYGIKGGVE